MTEAWNSLPQIQLFTVISLAIALTGAAYSVVVLLKEDHKEEIDSATQNGPDLLKEVKRVDNKSNIKEAQNAYDQIVLWEKRWKRRLRFPGYVFCVFVFVITVCVISQRDPSQLEYKWFVFQIALGLILIIDISAVCCAHRAYKKIKDNNDNLESRNRTAQKNLQTAHRQTVLPTQRAKSVDYVDKSAHFFFCDFVRSLVACKTHSVLELASTRALPFYLLFALLK